MESLNYEINYVLGDIYYAVVHFDLDAGTYRFVELTGQQCVDYPYNGTCEEFLLHTRDVVLREDWHKFKLRFSLNEMRRLLTKNGDTLEMELRRKDGGIYKWIQVMASYLPDFSGSKNSRRFCGPFYRRGTSPGNGAEAGAEGCFGSGPQCQRGQKRLFIENEPRYPHAHERHYRHDDYRPAKYR